MKKNVKIIILSAAAASLASIIIFFFMNRPELNLPEQTDVNNQKGLTFENMGENFTFSSEKRKELEKKFGNDVLESWSPISFEDFSPEFLNEFLAEIHVFSKQLQDRELREKTGRNSIKIKYPYAQRTTKVYKDVHLIFSGLTKMPLIFRISAYEHESFLASLEKKFSKPRVINYQDKIYYFWEKDNSVMIGEIKQDRYTKPYLSIVIYYKENIKNFFSSTIDSEPDSAENIF
ncbi:MAG: hypothetical protein AB7E04_04545 [Desulfobacteraceae bacterium]|jgi:hypothetical protein